MSSEHERAPEPTREQWKIRTRYLALGRSVRETAFSFGIERAEVIAAVDAVRWWQEESGWSARYAQAIRIGMPQADAELHADMEAERFKREHGL